MQTTGYAGDHDLITFMDRNKLSILALYSNKHNGENATVIYRGNSMHPLFKNGQTLMIDCKLSDKIQVGDIVIFKNMERLIAHRVVAICSNNNQRYYIEKGDNQLTYGLVRQDDLLGKVTAIDGNKKWLPWSLHTHIANYIFAKMSYCIAITYNAGRYIKRTIWGERDLPGGYFIHAACLRTSHLLLRVLLWKHNV